MPLFVKFLYNVFVAYRRAFGSENLCSRIELRLGNETKCMGARSGLYGGEGAQYISSSNSFICKPLIHKNRHMLATFGIIKEYVPACQKINDSPLLQYIN